MRDRVREQCVRCRDRADTDTTVCYLPVYGSIGLTRRIVSVSFHPHAGGVHTRDGESAKTERDGENIYMRLAALAVLVPLVRAACPNPVDPDNPECAGCESQAAADTTCRADSLNLCTHTTQNRTVPLCSILTKTILPVGNVRGASSSRFLLADSRPGGK